MSGLFKASLALTSNGILSCHFCTYKQPSLLEDIGIIVLLVSAMHTLTDSSQLGIYGQFIKSPRPPWLSQLPYLPVKSYTILTVHCLPCIRLQSFANGATDLSSVAIKIANLIDNFSDQAR